ncbi:hypothetical protein [Janibacter cremeus]|uniref:Capsular polysaccharide biosynthesis protein n=1 Tax=Janibacter cremeus TaxID=1285192 RepID=A0A852VWK4_9MICO|nr:hypothetical protein [Janibacter cremeus]NYF99033.1 capsular polysaccharide biosynthesis protein [Janibacter cremeus]
MLQKWGTLQVSKPISRRNGVSMDVWRITVAVLRRWYVFLPLLVVSGLSAYAVGEGVHPQYEVTATAILVPGAQEAEIDNPYGSIESTSDVLSIVLDGPPVRDELEDQGLNPDYEIDTRSRSSIIDVTVLSDTRPESVATAEEVLEVAQRELSQRQDAAGLPKDTQISLEVLRAPALSQVVTDGRMRNMAIVGIAGAALSLLVAILFDDLVGIIKRWVERRRRLRRSHPSELSPSIPRRERRGATPSDEPRQRQPDDTPSQPSAGAEAASQRDPTATDDRESASSQGRA